MASYNKVILMGNLTRDPELRTLPNTQTQVCNFSLAVNRRWKDAGGGDRDEVLFIDCAAFGKTGHIEGRLRFEQWEQEDGQKRSKIRVVVEQFRFVDRKPGNEPDSAKAPSRTRKAGGKRRTVEAEPVGAGAHDEIPI